jgi:hypothetical protein
VNPDTKTQIVALIAFVALAIKILFKIELPAEIQNNIVEIIAMIILTVTYFLRGAVKKLEPGR